MSGLSDDVPLRGLPAALPEGETILWQGAPDAKRLARDALHARHLVLYFAIAGVVLAGIGWSQGRPLATIAVSLALLGLAGLAVFALAAGFAALVARTTVYTITDRRTVMRIGVALPITLNVPHARIVGAGLRTDPDGIGDIPIALGSADRVGFVHLWPHARPWRLGRPEPMLRAVPNAAQVAAIFARAAGSGELGRAAAGRTEAATTRPAGVSAAPSLVA